MARPVSNPPNPWQTEHTEWLGEPPDATLSVYEEQARSALSENDSPDIPFRWSLNPYRGCFHACAYCYARPTHELLGWGAGTDFDRRIVVKTNVAELLAQRFEQRSWTGEAVTMCGVTDPYQPLEANYELTRRCLEVFRDYRNPLCIITKGVLVRRDLDLLAEIASVTALHVDFSIPFADAGIAAALEPSVASPDQRFAAMAALSAAGIRTGLSLAPIVPGVNESDVPRQLERAAEAGARSAFLTLLRLPGAVAGVFEQRLREALPLRAERVLSGIRDVRDGALHRSGFGQRMTGTGPRWEALERLFSAHCRRLGLESSLGPAVPDAATFRRPGRTDTLFPT
jgi:DNA repair photolyase